MIELDEVMAIKPFDKDMEKNSKRLKLPWMATIPCYVAYSIQHR